MRHAELGQLLGNLLQFGGTHFVDKPPNGAQLLAGAGTRLHPLHKITSKSDRKIDLELILELSATLAKLSALLLGEIETYHLSWASRFTGAPQRRIPDGSDRQ